MNGLLELLEETAATTGDSALAVALRLVLAGVLGAWIATLYRFARPPLVRHPGLLPTLVVLSILITLVTLAVGTNVAVAFALVGTLAIVRFRTTVSDVRDTSFVIFSVAIGIAVGQDIVVAGLGIVVVTAAVLALMPSGTYAETGVGAAAGARSANATLQIDVSPPNADPGLYRAALERFGVGATLRTSSVKRDRQRLRLVLDCALRDVAEGPEIVTALLEHPEIVAAEIVSPPRVS